jgi:hypothetical protein
MPRVVGVAVRWHPGEELLERYVMRNCSQDESAKIEKHLRCCPACSVRLYSEQEWVAFVRCVLRSEKSERSFRNWKRERHKITAADDAAWHT